MMLKVTRSDIFEFVLFVALDQARMTDGTCHLIAASASLPRLSTLALGSVGCGDDGEREVLGCGGESDGRATAALFAVSQAQAGAHAAVALLEGALPLLGHAVASAGAHALYLFGGQQCADAAAPDSDQLWLWDVTLRRWSLVQPVDGVKPPARSYHAMCGAVDGSIFVFGGCCSPKRRLNDLWRFRDSRWSLLSADTANDASVPCARGGAAIHAAAAADQLFLFFGFCGHQLGDVWLFEAGRWERVAVVADLGAPAPRSVFASASLGAGEFVLFGGEREASTAGHAAAGTFHDDAWLFDAAARTWKRLRLQGSPSARGWCALSHAGARRLVLAGGLNDQNERLNEAFVLELQ